MTGIPDQLHRAFFKTFSLLAPGVQGALLRRYFDWWHRRPDPWSLATDSSEHHKYLATLDQVSAGAYPRMLEVGCSEGVFTELLAQAHPAAEITGIDISGRALERARRRTERYRSRVRFARADILEHEEHARFDLVFCAETLYYLGRHDRLRRASARLRSLTAPSGVLVLVHPWPEAELLHGFTDSDQTFSKISERVEANVVRPFAVSVYRNNQAALETGPSSMSSGWTS
ncbi:hypothetical protein GCM10009555_077490 [Acrocarpospora macrocephala]|uniref:Methyltransferase domain-containing protein n=1 Tax=Acrocarpospora macrocephala TaxID=150177 RepID=A0A5M3X2K9_9ACTN|nr:class I SAM-dependent methyltransferase [Acrocarpospora macrocephala]GES15977.1 hypothetical protein Amac_095750 [Acrocarpospora macrocephala]